MTQFTSALKDRAILLGWIAGLIVAAALLWSFTFSFRAAGLMRSANRALTELGDERRLSAPLSRPSNGQFPLGCWYTVERSTSTFFVFTVMRDGILVPLGAEISAEGRVREILPLGNHARQVFERIPQGLVNVYTRRIESVAAPGGGK
jgi:hypothetical protein